MPRWSKLARFLSALFLAGGLDHLLFIALDSPTSHYGLQLGVLGQLGFGALDWVLAALLYTLNARWSRLPASA